MLTIKSLKHEIEQLNNADDFIKYIDNNFFKIKFLFQSKTVKELNNEKFDLEALLFILEDNKLISKENSKIVNDFLIILFHSFEIIQFKSNIRILSSYLELTETYYQIAANIKFLNINNIQTDYHTYFDEIVSLLDKSSLHKKATRTLLLYFLIAMQQFKRLEDKDLEQSFKLLFIKGKNRYKILENTQVQSIISQITIHFNFNDSIEKLYSKSTKGLFKSIIKKSTQINPKVNNLFLDIEEVKIRKEHKMFKTVGEVKSRVYKVPDKQPTILDTIHETLSTFHRGMKLCNQRMKENEEIQAIKHQCKMEKLRKKLQKLQRESIDTDLVQPPKVNTQQLLIKEPLKETNTKKVLLIDLDGTLTDTAHPQFKPMKDGKIETNLTSIPIFKGAKEFIDYQKSINNQVIIVSDSHYRYVEKIAREIFHVQCISLCDKPNIDKIKKFINNSKQLQKKFIKKKEDFIFIGDTWLDIEVGRKLNIPTILVEFYTTNIIELRDGIGDRVKHIQTGATFYAKNFDTLNNIIKNPPNNLLALEGIFQNPIINTIEAIPVNNYYNNQVNTSIIALGRQQQGECDNYAVTQQYFNISHEYRDKSFIKSLAIGVENYLKSSIEIKNYDIITFVTDKKTTQPKNKMKEIFDSIEIDIQHEVLFEWKDNVNGSLRERNNRHERKEFIQDFLSVKNNINLEKKNIIIIDDQITTGATADSLINQLRQKGAKDIIFLGLFLLISNVANEKKCPDCGKNLIIKIRRSDGNKFFSCVPPKYKGNGCGYSENINNG